MKLGSHRRSPHCSHRLWRSGCVTLLMSLLFANANAQLALPRLSTAPLPTAPLPTESIHEVAHDLDRTVKAVATQLNSAAQTTLRDVTVRKLIRDYRSVLEADPNGAAIVRHQVMTLNPSAAALDLALAAGFSVVEDRTLDGLDMHLVVLAAPAGLATRRALQRLRTLDPSGSYDFNHVYVASGASSSSAVMTPPATGSNPTVRSDVKIGLIDGGVDATHAVFRNSLIHRWGLPCSDNTVPSAHGTAVASLMVGVSEKFHGAAVGATLYAADVYCGRPTGGALNSLAAALAWLAKQQVPVINISLVGPANALLEQLLHTMIAHGHIIVAAVGNDGPAAPPLYPAAYPGVVGVTGVDAHNRALIEAERGPQVMFAAPGADMAAATINDAFVAVRGTSFAAPIVAGLLANRMRQPDSGAAAQALAQLSAQARDLGATGPDKVYGNGLVGEAVRVAPALLMTAPAL